MARVRLYFEDHPHGFEGLAARLWEMLDGNVTDVTVTRPTSDGGRDAVSDLLDEFGL